MVLAYVARLFHKIKKFLCLFVCVCVCLCVSNAFYLADRPIVTIKHIEELEERALYVIIYFAQAGPVPVKKSCFSVFSQKDFLNLSCIKNKTCY